MEGFRNLLRSLRIERQEISAQIRLRAFHAELFPDLVPVDLDSTHAQVEESGNLFGAPALFDQG